MTIELHVHTTQTCTHSYSDGNQYGNWGASYSFSVDHVSLSAQDPYYSGRDIITVNFDVSAGDVVFVLSMTYGTGDSFGQSSGNGEVLWIFKDIALALKTKEAIIANDSYSITVQIEDDTYIDVHNPGHGYFDSVEDVSIEAFIVQP